MFFSLFVSIIIFGPPSRTDIVNVYIWGHTSARGMTKNQFGCYYFGARYDLNLNRNRPVICQMFCDLSSVVFFFFSLRFSWFPDGSLLRRYSSVSTVVYRTATTIAVHSIHYIPIWIFSDDNNHFFFLGGHYANKSISRVKRAAKRQPTDKIFWCNI